MSVVINETNFPDSTFRDYVSQYYDLDGDGALSVEEIAEVTSFDSRSISGINLIQGLEFFTEISTLNIQVQRVKGVDFSKLVNLESVRLWSYSLNDSENAVDLDFSENAKLKTIALGSRVYNANSTSYYRDIKSLVLSPNLQSLLLVPEYAYNSNLTGPTVPVLDFTNCSNIKSVIIEGFPVSSIIGLHNKQYLETINIRSLPISGSLDFSENTRLKDLAVSRFPNVTAINIDGCFALVKLYLCEIDLQGSFNAEPFNDLQELTVTGTSLYYLSLGQKNSLRILQITTTTDKIAFGRVDVRGCPIISEYTRRSPFSRTSAEICYVYAPEHGYDPQNHYANYYGYGATSDTEPYRHPLFIWEYRTVIVDVITPVISNSPEDVVCTPGTEVVYTRGLASLGNGERYRSAISKLHTLWQVSIDNGLTWIDADEGSLEGQYVFTAYRADSGKQYRCIVSNVAGTATSEPAKLTVLNSPGINSELTISIAGNGKNVTLVSDASGDELNYQWQISSDNVTWTNITENGTGETYSFTATVSQNHTYYRYRAWNLVGEAFSNSAELIVVTTPIIVASPVSVTKATGTEASFSANTQGEYLSFQWQVSSNSGESWTDIPDAIEDSYSFTASKLDSGKQYRCVVTNAAATVESAPATLIVYDPPTIVSRSTIQECVAEGTEVSLTVTASGDDLQYRWRVNQNGEWTDIENATDPSYTFTAAREDTGKRFQCYISNAVGNINCEIYDDPEHSATGATPITVVYQPNITDQTITTPVRTGNEVAVTVSAEGGRLSFQWQVSSNSGESWTDIPDAIEDSYSFTASKLDSGKQYRCHVENIADEAESVPVTLTVLDPPAIYSELNISPVGVGKPVTLVSNAFGDELNYQWEHSTDNVTWTDITENGTAETYSFTADVSQNHTYYRYRVWNDVGEAYSNAVELIVITKPNVTVLLESQIVAVNDQATFTVSASGEALSYQWQVSSNSGESWTDIPDATEDSYSFTASKSDSGKQYRCEVTNIAGTVLSDSASLKVLFEPVIVTNPSFPNRATDGDYVYCDAAANGDELQHQWYVKYAGIDQWYPIDAEASDIYTDSISYEHEPHQENGEWVIGARFVRLAFYVTKEFTGNKYYCEFWNDVGRVNTPETNELYVLFEPTIVSVSSPESAIRSGDPVSLSVVAEGGDLKYQWQVSTNNGSSWKNISTNGKKSTYSFTATSSQNGYQLRCKVTNAVGSVLCEPIRLKVLIPPSVSEGPASQSVGIDTTATFTALINGTDLTYQWQVSSDNGVAWIDISDTNAPSYSLTAGIEKDGHMYRCQASNELGFVTTASALLTVLTFPAIITQPSSATVEYASNVVFLVSATGGELAYQWEYSSDNGATWTTITKKGTNATYSFLAVDSQNGFLYHCIVGNKLGTVVSESASLTVLGSATTEEEMPVLVFAGKYLPSQMAAMIRSLPIGTNLDEIAFGARTVETLHATIGRFGSTDPRYYEEIAESINELKSLIAQLQSQNPSS